jgi:plasmid stabilization system protein ParE
VTISFSPEAEEDLVAVVSFLAERNPTAARELGERVFAVLDRLVAGDQILLRLFGMHPLDAKSR